MFGDQSAGLWTKTKYTESDHFIFQRKSAMIVSLITIGISKVLYLFYVWNCNYCSATVSDITG